LKPLYFSYTRAAHGLRVMLVIALFLAVPLPFLAQTGADGSLTNNDVARMIKAGVPENIILRKIQTSESNFSTSADALVKLKKAGASEAVLGAVLDGQSGGRGFASPPAVAPGVAPAGPAKPFHLPQFEAEMPFDSKTRGKISVGHNSIKVQRAGVSLFSLKWKEPTHQ